MGEGKSDGGKRTLTLLSPVGGPPLTYSWPLQHLVRGKCAVDEAAELLDTIRWIVMEYPVLREGPLDNATKNIIISDYDCMKELCDLYNSEAKKIEFQTNSTQRVSASKTLLRIILHRTYSHAVFDPEKLNSYQPFSAEVYGETSFEMVDQLIEDVPFQQGSTFLDLGSGVGQVVLQVAASNVCRVCYGIELASTPCYYAKAMEKHFVRWMKFFGKPYSEFKIFQGNFLDDKFRPVIQNSSTIFVNNFAFGASLNHKLKERFAMLPEGVKIISSAEFRPINFRITSRNITDVGTILRVREVHPRVPGSVSWTNNDVCYFIHTVDRTYLEEYMRLQRAKYGEKLDGLMMSADRKIKERCEDSRSLPALSMDDDKRTHLLSHLTEIEIPKITSLDELQNLLNSQLSQYISQCSSSYGEAALSLELEQSKIMKEQLEQQMEQIDKSVGLEEELAVNALDSRLRELGIKHRDPQGIGKELMQQVTGFKILHKRLDRLSLEISSYQTAVNTSLLSEINKWKDNYKTSSEYVAEVETKQQNYQEMVAQLPGYDLNNLATVCCEQVNDYKEKSHSLVHLFKSIESLERENSRIEKGLATKTDKITINNKAETEVSVDPLRHQPLPQPIVVPLPIPIPIPDAMPSKPSLPISTPHPVSKSLPVQQLRPKQQMIHPKPQLTVSPKPQPISTPAPPVKIPAELTKPRPKPSVVIEQRRVAEPLLPRIDAVQFAKDVPGMSHLDAILARNGLGHYISNDFKRHGMEPPISAAEQPLQIRQECAEITPSTTVESSEITPSTRVENGENTPSRPSSTTSSISHRSILQQQHKQMSNMNSLLIQQQTMAQREQNKEAPVRPEQLRPEQALLNVEPAQTTPRGELKQTEERVLSSGTVPAKFPTTSANNSSMLKTTSPRLQLTTQASKQTVVVPHYMLGSVNSKDSESIMSSKASSSAPAQITARPTPKPGGATTTTPSVPASTPFTHLSSSGSSYFSAYGAATDPIVQKPAPEPVYSAGALPKENDISKAQIQKPKHKYPFQFLNQVYITGYAIMIHTLRNQYPNLKPEVYNELLLKSNFNPYTYFEYIRKIDDFEKTLEQFYKIRPDIGEKCKTRAQRLAEKQAPTQQPVQQPGPASVATSSAQPLPITHSRQPKEPHPSVLRNNPTIIESYAPKGSAPAVPSQTQVVPAPMTTELKLTKPTRDMKSPSQFPFKSPASSINYPQESVNMNKTSPAKRLDNSMHLQYHHLSVESFKNEPKNKVRRRNASSDVKHKASSEPEKMSPTLMKEKSKKTDDVAEAAMVILQLQHSMQKKAESGQLENPRAELERQLAQGEVQTALAENPRDPFRTDQPKHDMNKYEPHPKDAVPRYKHLEQNFVRQSVPKQDYTSMNNHEYVMLNQSRDSGPYRSRESSGQPRDHDARPKGDSMNSRERSSNNRNGHFSDHKLSKADEIHKEKTLRDTSQYNAHREQGSIPYTQQKHPFVQNTLYRDPQNVSQNPPHVSQYPQHTLQDKLPLREHIQPTRDTNGQRDVHLSHVSQREQQSNHREVQMLDQREAHLQNHRNSIPREHSRPQNRVPPQSCAPPSAQLSNHRDSSNSSRESMSANSRPASKPVVDKISPLHHSNRSLPKSVEKISPQSAKTVSKPGDKILPREKEKHPPKMPDLNKPTAYGNIDPLIELQKELRTNTTVSAKPPLHNPRTHMITSASIPPPELKKARNFKDVQLRDLPSQPPEMRIAPIHSDSRTPYLTQPTNSVPHPVNNRPEEKKRMEENKRTDDQPKIPDHSSAKKIQDFPNNKHGDFSHSDEVNTIETNDIRRKIEVKTTPSVKKVSVKDNPKLTVVTKTTDAKGRQNQDFRAENNKNLHTSRIREEQSRVANDSKSRDEKLRDEQHKTSSANLAFEFRGSPDHAIARSKAPSDFIDASRAVQHLPRIKPSAAVSTAPEPLAEDPSSSPELVIEEEEKAESTVKAIPDSSRHSPDSSSTTLEKNGGAKLCNGGSSVLGYVLEDVSPPSTSPEHSKREITQGQLMETFLNNKRRRVDYNYNYPDTPPVSTEQGCQETPIDPTKHSKFSFSSSMDRPQEDKSYFASNGTVIMKDDISLSKDERPIQSQDLSSSSTDVSNNDNKKS